MPLFILHPNLSQADAWIGLDETPPIVLGIQYSNDEFDNDSRLLYLSLPFSAEAGLDLHYRNSDLQDFNTQFDSEDVYADLRIGINPELDLVLNYQFQGQVDELEIEQFGARIEFDLYPASLSVGVSDGDVVIFTRDEISPGLNLPERVVSDLDSISLTFGWWFETFNLSLSYRENDYSRDISALGSRPLLQLLVKPGVLAQSDLLLAEQSALSLLYPLVDRYFAWHWMVSRSEVDDIRISSLQMDWTEYLSENTNLLISVARSDEEEGNWSYVLGLEWIN